MYFLCHNFSFCLFTFEHLFFCWDLFFSLPWLLFCALCFMHSVGFFTSSHFKIFFLFIVPCVNCVFMDFFFTRLALFISFYTFRLLFFLFVYFTYILSLMLMEWVVYEPFFSMFNVYSYHHHHHHRPKSEAILKEKLLNYYVELSWGSFFKRTKKANKNFKMTATWKS